MEEISKCKKENFFDQYFGNPKTQQKSNDKIKILRLKLKLPLIM